MRLQNLFFLYLQRVRTHPLQELLALLGIAVGVALVFAVQVANTSVSGSVEQLIRGIAGSAELQVTARDPHGFAATRVREIARVPGVRSVAPIVEVHVNLRGGGARRTASLIGGDQRLLAMGGPLLSEFASPSLQLLKAIALPLPLARALKLHVGDPVRLETGARQTEAPLAALLGSDEIGPLVNSPIVLAPLRYAQQIGGLEGRVTRVLVDAEPGRTAAVRAALTRLGGDRLNIADQQSEARLLKQATAPNDQSTALFAAISALVGLLFAFNAMLLTVPERRRFLTDLRLEGLGELTVVRLVLFDAVVLGALASIIGLLLGEALSRNAFHATPGYLSYAFTVGDQRIVEPRSVIFAVVGGIGATLLAALRPLSDLFSRRPLDDVYREDEREDTIVPRVSLLATGVGLLLAAAATLALAPHAAMVGIALLVAAMLFVLPGLVAGVVRLINMLSHRVRSPILVVSVGELRATTTRSIALAATGALAVFGSVAVEGSHFDLQRGLDRDAHQFNARADVWITAAGTQNELATTPFHVQPTTATALAAVPHVRAVRRYRGAFLDVGDRRVWVVSPPRADSTPILPSQIVDGDLVTATRRLRGHGWVALSQALADEQGLALGDVVRLPTPHPVPLRLAATITNLGWSSGAAVLNAEDFRRAWGSADVSALQLSLTPGGSPTTVAAAARGVVGDSLLVETRGEREARFRTSTRQGLNRLTQIASLVLVAAALALAAALGGVVWSRRPRLAALKLSGFGDGDVWRALLLESAIVLGIGCSIGAVFGLCGQFMLTRWLTDSTGFPTSYAPAAWLAAATFAGITIVAVAIAAVPGYAAARVSPTASVQQD